MTGITTNICRLCLKTVQDLDGDEVTSDLEIINDSERDIIQIVMPQVDLDYSDKPMICRNCAKLLQQSFAFKSKCLEIEDSIHDYKRDEQHQINLEKILGIREDGSAKCIKICRTCLGYLENNTFTDLDQGDDLKCMLKKCLPELDVEVTLNPVICQFCEETLKQMHNFVTSCTENDEKIRFYFKQSDHITLEEIIRYNEDNFPCTKTNLGCSGDFVAKNLTFEVQNGFASNNIFNEQDEVYIVSDNENEFDATLQGSNNRYNTRKRPRSVKAVMDSDSTTDVEDFDWSANSCESMDTSDEEKITKPRKKPKVTKKPKKFKEIPRIHSIFCKYCSYVTTSELAARKHISSCPCNPFLLESLKKAASEKRNSSTPTLSHDTLSLENGDSVPIQNDEPAGGARNETVALAEEENPVQETLKITKEMGETSDTPSVEQETRIAEKSSTEDLISDAIKTAEEVDCREQASDGVVAEAEVVDDPSIAEAAEASAEPEVESVTNETLKMIKIERTVESEIFQDESRLKDIQLAIENNKKELFSELTVLVCNRCSFNSRSILKMAIHCGSHSNNGEKTVDYGSGYRNTYYCVNCSESYRTEQCLRSHAEGCLRSPDDKAFLLKVGEVMHCTKCYFDSDDKELVLQHLLKCGDISVR